MGTIKFLFFFFFFIFLLLSCNEEKSFNSSKENLDSILSNSPVKLIDNYENPIKKLSLLSSNPNIIGKVIKTHISLDDFLCLKKENYTQCVYSIHFLNGKGGRIHFSNVNIPKGAKLYVFDKSIKEVYDEEASSSFWTVNFNQKIYIVFEYNNLNQPPFIIDKVSNLWEENTISPAYIENYETIDLKCMTDSLDKEPWKYAKSAVMIILSDEYFTYQCSGNLIASKKDNNDPLLITARHCFNDNDKLLENAIFWFDYYNSECNSLDGQINRHYTKGGKVLYKSDDDIAIIEIKGSLKTDKYKYSWLNWNDNAICENNELIGFSFPRGKPLKYHSGNLSGKCYIKSTSSKFSATCSNQKNANGFNIIWNTGYIDKGSSGSAILKYCLVDNDNYEWIIAGILSAKFRRSSSANGIYADFYTFLEKNKKAKKLIEEGLPDDKFEENDSIEKAYNKWKASKHKCRGIIKEKDLYIKDGDNDWYEIFVPKNCKLTLKVNFRKEEGKLNIKIFDSKLNLLSTSSSFEYISRKDTKIYLNLSLEDDTYQNYDLFIKKKSFVKFPSLLVHTDKIPDKQRFKGREKTFYTNEPIDLTMDIHAQDELYDNKDLKMCISINSVICKNWSNLKKKHTFTLKDKKEGIYDIYIFVKNPENYINSNKISLIYDKTPPINGKVKVYIKEKGNKFIWRKFKDKLSGIEEYRLVYGKNKNISCSEGEILYQGKNRSFFHYINTEGTSYYILCAKDKAGNWSKGIKITVKR